MRRMEAGAGEGEYPVMSKFFKYGGLVASIVLIAFGVGSIYAMLLSGIGFLVLTLRVLREYVGEAKAAKPVAPRQEASLTT